MEIAKENACVIREPNLKKGKGLSLQLSTPSGRKTALLRDVGNTLHSKAFSEKKISNAGLNTKSPFQMSYKSNSPIQKSPIFKSPFPVYQGLKSPPMVVKSLFPIPQSANESKKVDDKLYTHCCCESDISEMYSEMELPESLKLTDDDIDSLATCWLKPKHTSNKFSCSPIDTSFLDFVPSSKRLSDTENLFPDLDVDAILKSDEINLDNYLWA